MKSSVPDSSGLIAVRRTGQAWLALEICIKGDDVYVNHFLRDGRKQAHVSYHSSGQRHIKTNGDYVKWTGSPDGSWQPLKIFEERPATVVGRVHIDFVMWEVKSLSSVLAPLTQPADIVIDAEDLPGASLLALECSLVGPAAVSRDELLGFQVLQRYRLSGSLVVEVEAVHIVEDRLLDGA